MARGEITNYSFFFCFCTFVLANSSSSSRVKLYYHNKKFNSEIYIEGKDSVIFFCPNKDCGAAEYYSTLGFDSWQEYTEYGFPIATSNRHEQIHSLQGHFNFIIDAPANKYSSRICQSGKFQNGMEKCKGVYVSGKVCPKHVESSSPYAPPATSVLTQDLDITVLKEPASFYFRNTPDYVVDLNPLDTVILVKIRGWNFCNLTHVTCPVLMDNSHKTYLIWTMQFNLDNARPWLVEETNHYKKYSFDKKGCLYLPKFYQRRKSGIQYSLSHNSVSVQQNSKDPVDAQSLLNLTGNSNDWASDSSDSLFMKPLWFKQPPGFPSTDQVTRFSFLMEQTENLYDETVFEIVYKTNFVRDDSDIARC